MPAECLKESFHPREDLLLGVLKRSLYMVTPKCRDLLVPVLISDTEASLHLTCESLRLSFSFLFISQNLF